MSVFLTPDLRPFYAGTYFPPVPRHNLPSFRQLLEGLARAWGEQRDEITGVGLRLAEYLRNMAKPPEAEAVLTLAHLDAVAAALVENYDWGYGGWGSAPKFPQPMTIEYLLARAAQSHSDAGLEEAGAPGATDPRAKELQAALHALKAMARGGMYDVVGGGFSRYSTDNFWRVPHFEKMLYDNALLARAYLHAWQLTGDPFYRRITVETLDFVGRELSHPAGGFFSSLDADSEGQEGKFYVWTLEEIQAVLGNEADFFVAAYGITARGNWEGRTVLQRALDDSSLAARFSLRQEEVTEKLRTAHEALLAARSRRVRPGTDDKVLTAWNGLMLAAFAEAGRVLDERSYTDVAIRNAGFLLQSLRPAGELRRSWRESQTGQVVFLEDYAALILGLIELYQTDFNVRWFRAARELAGQMVERFADHQAGGFFDTPSAAADLLVRPRDTQDNATPSGGALATEALLRLAELDGSGEYRTLAERALAAAAGDALKYPTAYARWLGAAHFALNGAKQIALIGTTTDPGFTRLLEVVRSRYRPLAVVAASSLPLPEGSPSLLADRPEQDGKATAYVCEGFVCNLPAIRPEDLTKQLN